MRQHGREQDYVFLWELQKSLSSLYRSCEVSRLTSKYQSLFVSALWRQPAVSENLECHSMNKTKTLDSALNVHPTTLDRSWGILWKLGTAIWHGKTASFISHVVWLVNLKENPTGDTVSTCWMRPNTWMLWVFLPIKWYVEMEYRTERLEGIHWPGNLSEPAPLVPKITPNQSPSLKLQNFKDLY